MAYDVQFIHSGTAVSTTLASDVTNVSTTISLTSASGWPSPTASQKAVGTIKVDSSTEAKFTYTGKSGNDLTGVSWNFDGTTAASSYTAGTTVEHTISAREMDEANGAARNTLGRITAIGDFLYADSTTTLARLAKGTAYQALIMNSGATAPSWGSSLQSLLAAKGGIVTASAANTPAYLAPGSDFQHFRARAGATNGVEWASLATSAIVSATETTTSDSFTDLSTPGPAVTVTTGTTALVVLTGGMQNDTNGDGCYMGFAVSGSSTVAANANDALTFINPAGANTAQVNDSIIIPVSGLTAGSNTFTAKYRRVTGGTASFFSRRITVIPL